MKLKTITKPLAVLFLGGLLFSFSSCQKESVDIDGILSTYYMESQNLYKTDVDSTMNFTNKFTKFSSRNKSVKEKDIYKSTVKNITDAFYTFGYRFELVDDYTFYIVQISLNPVEWEGSDELKF